MNQRNKNILISLISAMYLTTNIQLLSITVHYQLRIVTVFIIIHVLSYLQTIIERIHP